MPHPTPRTACPNCGYPIAGLPRNLCPECGQAFSPFAEPSRWQGLAWALAAAALGCFELSLYGAAVLAGSGEPYRGVADYVGSILTGAVILAGLLFLLVAGMTSALWLPARPSPQRIRAARTGAMYFAAALLPVSICSFAWAFLAMRDPGLDLAYQAKPPWIKSPLLDIVAHPVTMLTSTAAAVLLARRCRPKPPPPPDRLRTAC